MARITLTGVLQTIGTTQSFGNNGFRKRDIVVMEEGTKYPNPIKFTLKKDYCELADNFHEGDKVTVSASLSGREWTNPKTNAVSYFLDLDAYKIEDAEGGAKQGRKGSSVPPPVSAAELSYDTADVDDMPF